MNLWRTLHHLWYGKKLVVPKRRQAPIDLHALGAFYQADDLVRVNWSVVEPAVTAAAATGAFTTDEYFCSAVEQWLTLVGDGLSPRHVVRESEHFMLLVPESRDAEIMLRSAERVHQLVWGVLGSLGSAPEAGKHVLLTFDPLDHYYTYISHSALPDGHIPESTGMCIRIDLTHIAMPLIDAFDGVLAHEMVHDMLAHRNVPLWLEEGLATSMESELVGHRIPPNRRTLRMHARYWSWHGMNWFWDGRVFEQPSKGRNAAYELAQLITTNLFTGRLRSKFADFVIAADPNDGGAAAATEHLGITLGHMVEELLGPGPWEPTVIPHPKADVDGTENKVEG